MLVRSNDWANDAYFQKLFDKTILNNKFIPYRIKKGILSYPEEIMHLYELNKFALDPLTREPEINEVLTGGARFGGKTLMGAVDALQFIEYTDWVCTVTRNTYDDLFADGKDSIFGYISLWQEELDLPKKEKLDIKEGKKRISNPNGGLINFKAFNYDKKADSLQSKSNKRIIADEALQLSLNIIQDFKPTLRQEVSEYYPLSISFFGNPQLNNPEVNNYFNKTFVKGKFPYINMDLNNNPLINRNAYINSFKGLNKAKREAFLKGNFGYKLQKGDLIEQADLNNATFNPNKIRYSNTASILFLDLAGRGRDKFAIATITILQSGRKLLDNITQTKAVNAVKTVHKHIREDNKRGIYPNLAILEMEGGSWVYTEAYWINIFLTKNIPADTQNPIGSKYMRAMPVSEEIIEKELLINRDLKKKVYLEDEADDDNDTDYFTLFSDEMISMLPVMKKSPNLVDSVSLGVNYINNNEISIK